jgi:hypothetical protein
MASLGNPSRETGPRNSTGGAGDPDLSEQDLNGLPEPTRSHAYETFRRLLAEGRDRADAATVAFREAQELEASRMGGGKPE